MGQDDLEKMMESDFSMKPESSEAIKEMFRDGIEKDTNRRIIDQKSDISPREQRNLAAADFFHAIGIFEHLDVFTHSFKRLSVSKNRKGRTEAVEMFRGSREHTSGAGFMSRMMGGGQRP